MSKKGKEVRPARCRLQRVYGDGGYIMIGEAQSPAFLSRLMPC